MKRLSEVKGIPKTLKAGYRHYDISCIDTDHELETKYSGACAHRKRKIDLDGEQSSGEGSATLLHEIVHVAYAQGSLDEIIERHNEEKIVDILSNQLAMMMHDNSDLFRWIIKNVG